MRTAREKINLFPPLKPPLRYAQAGPSEGASRGVVKRDRLAVAAHGCNTHTQRAAAEAAWSRRHGWRHRVLWWQRRNSVPNGQALQQPKAVGRKHSATGGHAEESLKHRARDAGEKADLRFYQYRTAISAEIAVLLRCREMPEPVGPPDPRRPARPRTPFESASAE